MSGTVGSTEFVEAAGITYRQLDHWTRAGYLRATHPTQPIGTYAGPAHGYPRSYDADQIPTARLMGQLLRAGFTRLSTVHDVATRLTATGRADVVLDPSARLTIRKVTTA